MPCNVNFTLSSIENLSIFKQNPKLLIKLKQNTDEDSFYETHQLYKTINFRCMSNDLIDESLDLIFNGIVYFAWKNQLHCCNDLSKVFVESLKKTNKTSLDNELLNRIKNIHLALRDGIEERNEFSVSVLKWSSGLFNDNKQTSNKPTTSTTTSTTATTPSSLSLFESSQANYLNIYQKRFGHADIHREFAHNLWKEKNYVQARYHFLHSLDGQSLADMLIECHLNYGYPSEADLFLTQAVLQYLCIRNVATASQFYESFIKNHPYFSNKINSQPQPSSSSSSSSSTSTTDYNIKDSPLLNFIKFLFIAIKTGKVKLFKTLTEIYKPSLDRDPSLNDYLERVGQYFFNLKPSKPERENMFSNLIRMLTNDSNQSNSNNSNTNNNNSNNNNEPNSDSERNDDDWDSSREEIEDNDLLD